MSTDEVTYVGFVPGGDLVSRARDSSHLRKNVSSSSCWVAARCDPIWRSVDCTSLTARCASDTSALALPSAWFASPVSADAFARADEPSAAASALASARIT